MAELELIYLEGPSGKLWEVKLSKKGVQLYLEDGWKEFTGDHHVMEDDYLVFNYCGKSSFTVLFFDKNGCEKEASYFVKGRVCASTKVLRAQKKCISNSSELNECSHMKVGHCDDKQHSTDDGSDGSFSGDFYCSGSKRNFSPDRCFKSSITKKLCNNQDASKLISFLRTEKMIKEMKQNSSQAEIPALSFAKSISKRNPCFFKVLTKTSIRTKLVLVIPNDFVAAFKLFNPQIIIL